MLFQVISDNCISNLCINAYDQRFDKEIKVYKSLEITKEKETNNIFIINSIMIEDNYFSHIYINSYFTEYLEYFFEEKIDIKNTVKKDLIEKLNSVIANTKDIYLSVVNILKFIKYCGILNVKPKNLDNIKIPPEIKRNLDKIYYLSEKFIMNHFTKEETNMICSVLFKIFYIYDI